MNWRLKMLPSSETHHIYKFNASATAAAAAAAAAAAVSAAAAAAAYLNQYLILSSSEIFKICTIYNLFLNTNLFLDGLCRKFDKDIVFSV